MVQQCGIGLLRTAATVTPGVRRAALRRTGPLEAEVPEKIVEGITCWSDIVNISGVNQRTWLGRATCCAPRGKCFL